MHYFVSTEIGTKTKNKIQCIEMIRIYKPDPIAISTTNISMSDLRRRSYSYPGVHIGQSVFSERLNTESLALGLQILLSIVLSMRIEEKKSFQR